MINLRPLQETEIGISVKAKARAWLTIGVCLIVLASTLTPVHAQRSVDLHLGPNVKSSPDGAAGRDVRDLAALVRKRGLAVDLEWLCQAAELDEGATTCKFRQLPISLVTGHDDILALNVPDTSGEIPFVLVFHVAKDLGELYVVSLSGELLRAYVRTADGKFVRADNGKVNQAFLIDMAYWSRNLARIFSSMGLERPVSSR